MLKYAKLLKANCGYYLYDTISNRIEPIDANVYQYIKNYEEGVINTSHHDKYTNFLNASNFRDVIKEDKADLNFSFKLSDNYLKSLYNNSLHTLTLALTEECNLRCIYCVYGNKYDPHYIKKDMSIDIAKKAIKFLFSHSVLQSNLHIGFYGGECLLKFSILKECVEYAISLNPCSNLTFGLTTNGILLKNKEIREFLYHNNVRVLVSLDGCQSIHDEYRINVNGDGSYSTIIENLKIMYSENRQYCLKYVSINAVYRPPYNNDVLDDYFNNIPFQVLISSIIYPNKEIENIISNNASKYSNDSGNYSEFTGKLLLDDLKSVRRFHDPKPTSVTKVIPCGPCIPGRPRFFVNVDGNIYPCERVPINSEYKIGDIDNGICFEKVQKMLYKFIEDRRNTCDGCWAVRHCSKCFKNLGEPCNGMAKRLENSYIYYLDHLNSDSTLAEYYDSFVEI